MESLAMLVMAIAIAFGFIAAFLGFIVGDNIESLPISLLAALIPAAGFGWYTQNIAVSIFWICCFSAGHVLGRFFL